MILISGITGFLGINVSRLLLEKQIPFIGISRKKNKLIINNTTINLYSTIKFIDLEKLFLKYKIKIIIHLATEYGRSNAKFDQIYKCNVELPRNLYILSIKYNAECFLNCESFLQKGIESQYNNHYLSTKNEIRKYLKKNYSGTKIINLQLEHVYGPEDNENKLIPSVINSAINNNKIIKLGYCDLERDMIYVLDAANAFLSVIDNYHDMNNGEILEVGTGKSIKLWKVLYKILDLLQLENKVQLEFSPNVRGQLRASRGNNNRLLELGWIYKYSLNDGLIKTIKYYKKLND